MQYTVKHRAAGWIRIRLAKGKLTLQESRELRLAILALPQVRDVRLFMQTGGIGISYDGEEGPLLTALKDLDPGRGACQAYPDTEPESPFLDTAEIKQRGLAPHVKRKMRMQLLTEAAFDAIMPAPVQLTYHAYQLYNLEKM